MAERVFSIVTRPDTGVELYEIITAHVRELHGRGMAKVVGYEVMSNGRIILLKVRGPEEEVMPSDETLETVLDDVFVERPRPGRRDWARASASRPSPTARLKPGSRRLPSKWGAGDHPLPAGGILPPSNHPAPNLRPGPDTPHPMGCRGSSPARRRHSPKSSPSS